MRYRVYQGSTPEHVRASRRAYYAANRERISAYGRAHRRIQHPPRPRSSRCEVCGNTNTGVKQVIEMDHCHLTDKFRGWLCGPCNRALGHVQDSPIVLRALADYIEQSRKQ